VSVDVRSAFNQIVRWRSSSRASGTAKTRSSCLTRMGFGHLSSPAFFNGVIGPLLQGINHGQQRCRSYLDDISGGAKGG
jgi:hypothetical protein